MYSCLFAEYLKEMYFIVYLLNRGYACDVTVGRSACSYLQWMAKRM